MQHIPLYIRQLLQQQQLQQHYEQIILAIHQPYEQMLLKLRMQYEQMMLGARQRY